MGSHRNCGWEAFLGGDPEKEDHPDAVSIGVVSMTETSIVPALAQICFSLLVADCMDKGGNEAGFGKAGPPPLSLFFVSPLRLAGLAG